MPNTVLRNAIVQPFPTRTPLLESHNNIKRGKGDSPTQMEPTSGVNWTHIKFFQSVEAGVNASVQIQSAIPATSAARGVPGTIAFNANFLYICIAANTWRRVALVPF